MTFWRWIDQQPPRFWYVVCGLWWALILVMAYRDYFEPGLYWLGSFYLAVQASIFALGWWYGRRSTK